MAVQQLGDMLFEGRLTVSVPPAWMGCDRVKPSPDGMSEPQAYFSETVGTRPERLKINAPLVRFAWYAQATGGEGLDRWKAGLLQSISHAAWAAFYSNGRTLEYRLNTERRLVRDGRPDVCPFYSE